MLSIKRLQKWTLIPAADYRLSFHRPDGTVYIGTTSSLKFFAINPKEQKNGSLQATERIYSSAALGADGRFTSAPTMGSFRLCRGRNIEMDCSSLWLPFDHLQPLPRTGLSYVGRIMGNVSAINSAGTLVWNFPTGNNVYSSPVIGPTGNGLCWLFRRFHYAIAGK